MRNYVLSVLLLTISINSYGFSFESLKNKLFGSKNNEPKRYKINDSEKGPKRYKIIDDSRARQCGELKNGESTTVVRFKEELVPFGTPCLSEKQIITCENGIQKQTGTFKYESCDYDIPLEYEINCEKQFFYKYFENRPSYTFNIQYKIDTRKINSCAESAPPKIITCSPSWSSILKVGKATLSNLSGSVSPKTNYVRKSFMNDEVFLDNISDFQLNANGESSIGMPYPDSFVCNAETDVNKIKNAVAVIRGTDSPEVDDVNKSVATSAKCHDDSILYRHVFQY